MKKKFVLFSKIILGLFFVAIAVMVGMALFSDSDTIIMSNYVGIPCTIIFLLTGITFLALFVLECIEKVKEKEYSFILEIFISIIVITAILALCDRFVSDTELNIVLNLSYAAIISVAAQSVNFWKRTK